MSIKCTYIVITDNNGGQITWRGLLLIKVYIRICWWMKLHVGFIKIVCQSMNTIKAVFYKKSSSVFKISKLQEIVLNVQTINKQFISQPFIYILYKYTGIMLKNWSCHEKLVFYSIYLYLKEVEFLSNGLQTLRFTSSCRSY